MYFSGKCYRPWSCAPKVFLLIFQRLGHFRLVSTRTGSQIHKASVGVFCPTKQERAWVDLISGSVQDSKGPWLAEHQAKNQEKWFWASNLLLGSVANCLASLRLSFTSCTLQFLMLRFSGLKCKGDIAAWICFCYLWSSWGPYLSQWLISSKAPLQQMKFHLDKRL